MPEQVLNWAMPVEVAEQRTGEWTLDRVDAARRSLISATAPKSILPPTEVETQAGLNSWWRDEGQFIPRHILDELGVSGGAAVPTTFQQIDIENKDAGKHLKQQLGIKSKGDPLELQIVPLEGPADPGGIVEPAFPEANDVIRSVSDDELDKMFQIMNKDVFSFPAEVVRSAVEEREIRDKINDVVLPALAENPLMVLSGTQFFNQLGRGLPELFGDKDTKLTLKAIGRVREQVIAQDPDLLARIGGDAGKVMADVVLFAALPDPSKAALFSRLTPAAKAAIGVGTKAGLVEALQAPEEGETIEGRALAIAEATGIGAVTGATLSKLFTSAKAVFTKIKDLPVAKQADEILFNNPDLGMSKQEVVSVLKNLKSTNAAQFKAAIEFKPAKAVPSRVVPTPRQIPGARTGFAETGEPIEKAAQAAGKLAKEVAKPKTVEAAAVEAAKALASKAPPVKPVQPKKIVSPEEAGPFKITSKLGAKQTTRLIEDPKVRAAVQVKENQLADLRTRLKQAKADAKVDKAKGITVEKAKAAQKLAKQIQVDIDKQVAAVDKEKLRGAVKLVETRTQAALKLEKIRTATEFRDEMRQEALSMVQAIPKELRPAFISRASKAKTLKNVQRLGDEIEAGIENFDRKAQITEFKKTVKDIEKKNKRGVVRLGLVPSPQRESLIEIIDSIDPVKLSEAKEKDLLSLQKHMNRIAPQLAGDLSALDAETEQAVMLPGRRQDELLRLSKKPAHEMDSDDIAYVIESIKDLAQQAKLKSSLLLKDGFKPVDKVLDDISSEIHTTKRQEKKLAKGEPEKTELTKLEKARLQATKAVKLNEMHLDTLVEVVTGPEKEALKQILDYDLHEGQRKQAEKIIEWTTRSSERFKELGFKGTEQLEPEHTVTLGKKKVTLTADHLVKLELKTRDPRNLKAMLGTQGWKIGEFEVDYPPLPNPSVSGPQPGTMSRAARMKELSDIVQIVRDDPMLMGLADWTNELNPVQAEAINETSRALKGFDVARDVTYTSNPRSLPKKVGPKLGEAVLPPEQAGRYQKVVGGNRRLRLDKWSDDFLNALESDSVFHGMTIPLRNARIVVGSKTFQESMKQAGRKAELDTMITLLNRIQGVSTSRSIEDALVGKIRSKFTQTALGLRVSTIGTQAMSYPAFFAEISPVYARPLVPVSGTYIGQLKEDSPILHARWSNRKVGADVGEANIPEAFDLTFFGKTRSVFNKSMAGLVKGDEQAIANGHKAAVREILGTKRNGKNVKPEDWNGVDPADLVEIKDKLDGPSGYPSTPALKEAAARRTEYITRRTQPVFDMLDRSVSQSNPSAIERSFFMFRTALEAQENVAMRAFDAYVKSPKKLSDKAELSQAVGAVATSAFSVAVWKTAFKWGTATGATALLGALGIFKANEKKEAKETATKLAKDTAKNLVSLNKFGRFVVDISERVAAATVGDGYNWNRETFDSPVIETLEQGVGATVSISKSVFNLSRLDDFIPNPQTADELKFNEDLADEIVKDWTQAVRSTYNFGVRITGAPLLAPTQEFINPLLKRHKISLIRELSFENADDPQGYAQRVFDLYDLRAELKNKKDFPTPNEQQAIANLDRFVKAANQKATAIREEDSVEKQKQHLKELELNMQVFEDNMIELGIKK